MPGLLQVIFRICNNFPERITSKSGALPTESTGWTPLFISASSCRLEAMKLLLRARANLDAAAKTGRSQGEKMVSSVSAITDE